MKKKVVHTSAGNWGTAWGKTIADGVAMMPLPNRGCTQDWWMNKKANAVPPHGSSTRQL